MSGVVGMKKGGRPLGYHHQDDVRRKIQAIHIVQRLQDAFFRRPFKDCMGRELLIDLTANDIRIAEILLKKCIPDLAQVAHSGEIGIHYVARLPNVAENVDEWTKNYQPLSLQ